MSVRPLRLSVLIAFLLGVGVLSFSDRAPALVKGSWRFVQRIGSFGERFVGFDVIDRGDIPFAFDTLGHLVLWSIAGVLAFMAFGRRTSASFLIVSLITLSAGVEVGQGLLSSSRHPELRDLAANSVGVTFGVLVAAVTFWTIGMFGRFSSNLTR